MDLSAFHVTGGNVAQIVVTGFTPFYQLLDDLIGERRPGQARSPVSLLPTRFLLAFLPQTSRPAREPIRRRRQTAIVAVFGLSLLQRVHLLRQAPDLGVHLLHQGALLFQRGFQLLDPRVTLRQLFITLHHLLSQMGPFFFARHSPTLPGLPTFGKLLLTWAVTNYLGFHSFEGGKRIKTETKLNLYERQWAQQLLSIWGSDATCVNEKVVE